jgi:hypothetical protein
MAKAERFEKHPNLFTVGISLVGGADVLAGPDLGNELRNILFPTARDLTLTSRWT